MGVSDLVVYSRSLAYEEAEKGKEGYPRSSDKSINAGDKKLGSA